MENQPSYKVYYDQQNHKKHEELILRDPRIYKHSGVQKRTK